MHSQKKENSLDTNLLCLYLLTKVKSYKQEFTCKKALFIFTILWILYKTKKIYSTWITLALNVRIQNFLFKSWADLHDIEDPEVVWYPLGDGVHVDADKGDVALAQVRPGSRHVDLLVLGKEILFQDLFFIFEYLIMVSNPMWSCIEKWKSISVTIKSS